MPKEVFYDRAGMDNSLSVKWGVWGTVEIATETKTPFGYPFAKPGEDQEEMRGWWLSLSKKELGRLIKTLKKAHRQYDSAVDRRAVQADEWEPEGDVSPPKAW